jgi:hypothetical protein
MSTRPRAEELADAMLERPAFEANPRARPRLTPLARRFGKEVRCPKRHLLAAAVRTEYGPWLVWHGDPFGHGWRCRWLDEVPDRAELSAWCAPCHNLNHVLDLSDFVNPRLVR